MNNSLIYLVLGLGCISAQIPAASSSANIRVPRQFPPFPDGSCQSCRPVPTFPTVNRLANFAPCSFWMGSNGADCWQCCQQKAFENQWGQLFLVSPSFDGTFNTCVCCTNSCDGGFPPTGGVVAAAIQPSAPQETPSNHF
ncbi:unnamed protein product, partial [Mesorhabditis belari]|uniref:Secreted protein n=1 Tax=Mesorhabditis belari TaxID=2138241 RepID=A0AAF3ERZ1_9BILA